MENIVYMDYNDKLADLKGENIMNTSIKLEAISIKVEAQYRKARSAWSRGVLLYADELLDNVWADGKITEKSLLNGARDWQEYSEGGCSLIYDDEICHRLCTPCEIKRKRGGDLPPNKNETWLDVQARALYQAAHLIISITANRA